MSLGQPLFGQEICALLHCLFGLAANAQVAQPLASTDQLLIEPGGADVARLALDGRCDFSSTTTQPKRCASYWRPRSDLV